MGISTSSRPIARPTSLVAPVYSKEANRIEVLFRVSFLALGLQTLLERELLAAIGRAGSEALPLYPEGRPCRRLTTRSVIDALASLARNTFPDVRKIGRNGKCRV